MRITSFILVVCSLLIACQQSPRKNYYLLNGPSPAPENIATITHAIGIGPIELPDYLQRPQMVRHQGNNELNMADNEYWAERLDKGIVRVLGLHLTRRNSSRIILPFPWRQDSKPAQSLRLHIHELTLIDQRASINATWELVDNARKNNPYQQHFIRSVPAKDNAAGMASGYSELFAQMADEMDKALRTAGKPSY